MCPQAPSAGGSAGSGGDLSAGGGWRPVHGSSAAGQLRLQGPSSRCPGPLAGRIPATFQSGWRGQPRRVRNCWHTCDTALPHLCNLELPIDFSAIRNPKMSFLVVSIVGLSNRLILCYRIYHKSLCFAKYCVCVRVYSSPQSGHGVCTTPINFYLIKKRFPSSQ